MTLKHRLTLALVFILSLAFWSGTIASAATTDLIISEYGEGSSLNKYIEIYNGTGTAVDLSTYQVWRISNGGSWPEATINLTGTLNDGETAVVYNPSADPTIASAGSLQISSGNISHNGDDAVGLAKNGVLIDAVGADGPDVGTGWEVAGISNATVDHVLVRKATVCAPNTNWNTSRGSNTTDSEWIVLNNQDWSNIGSHSANCGTPPPSTPEILLTEVVVTPTAAEFVEIHNPTSNTVDLSDFYLTDATFAGGSTYYYNIVTGSNAGGGSFGDFHARFPDGATIGAGEYQTIAISGSGGFVATYGTAPTYELFDDSSNDGEQLMREAVGGSINGQGGLTNSGEVVVLYHWDGASDLVTDMDYLLWGDKAEAVDKTGVSLDGPDADSDASSYAADTASGSQDVVAGGGHAGGVSWQRDDLNEGSEISSGGNGVNGEDETSENVSVTWCEDTPTPGAASDCPIVEPPTGDWVINEVHADPDSSIAGDANGDGTRDTTDDEFVEIVNNSGVDVDISGWTVSDAVGVRHTFPTGTVVPASCAIVVFGGGAPTGAFGNSVVQTASSNSLGFNNGGDTVTLNNGTADVASYSYGSEGGANQSLTLDPDVTGSAPLVQHTGATGANGALYSPGTLVDGSNFAGCTAAETAVFIHEIQGNGAASPLVGSNVLIEGIVVGDFQDSDPGNNGDLNGFFVQEEDSDADGDAQTSEGIFVFDGSSPAVNVSIGDKVRVKGQVTEFDGLTEINNVTEVTVVSSGNAAPTSATLSLPIASPGDFEAFEGMSVTFPQSLAIVEYFNFDRFGEIVLAPERLFQPTAVHAPGSAAAAALADLNSRSRLTLDDGRTASNPDPALHPNGSIFDLTNRFRGGDTLTNVTGVMHYAFDLYRVQPTQGADYTAANPRPADHDPVGGTLEVASFNVLNYFTTLGSRGADDPAEFTRQRDKIFAALRDIDADVVGLIEIENNGTALTDLVDGLNNLVGAGTYAALNTGPIGSDEITVAFIYKPAAVSLVGSFAVLDDPSFVNPNTPDPKNRPALAQTFIDNNSGGVFTVVVNHLKSKGSGCGAGDDDAEQGNCNLTRTLAAQALANWLATDPTSSGDADVLIIGDLNAYDKEDPITALTNAGYTDLEGLYGGEEAYSYVFDGQLGYLDYALANSDLLDEVTGAAAWHINADEPDLLDYDMSFKQPAQDALYEPNAFRASDHDPVVVGLAVCDEIAPSLTVTVSPDTLWPPNHKYVTVEATLDASDNFDQNPIITLLPPTSNEPDNGLGDGDKPNDIVVVDDTTFKLRAERSGNGNGRIYTISYEITDACGNSSTASATVTVPKNKGK